MDVREAIETRLELREFTDEPVDDVVRETILEAGRLAPSGKNAQHWRFILVDAPDDLDRLADLSDLGSWVSGADFAVVVLTDPDYYYHDLDAGRAITHMQLAAWGDGVGSCIYTGYNGEGMRAFLDIPEGYTVSAVVGFGHTDRELRGVKNRVPLSEVAYEGTFGNPVEFA